MNLAFNSKHPFVPNPKTDPSISRWIASLSDGSTVFEDVTPHERSAWARLSDYISVHSLKITNLRLEAYGKRVILIPYKDDDGRSQINGYWYSKKLDVLVHPSGVLEALSCGIGILKGKEIWVTWVGPDGSIRQEIKDYKAGDRAVIVNDPPS